MSGRRTRAHRLRRQRPVEQRRTDSAWRPVAFRLPRALVAAGIALTVLGSALVVTAPRAKAPRANADMTTAVPLAGPAGALGGAPVRGRPIVIGRSPGAPVRVRDAGVLGAAITPDPALADGADGRATIALARQSARDVVVRRVSLRVALPPSARATGVTAPDWACAITAGDHR